MCKTAKLTCFVFQIEQSYVMPISRQYSLKAQNLNICSSFLGFSQYGANLFQLGDYIYVCKHM